MGFGVWSICRSGFWEVRAVNGSNMRQGNIWENIELPRLKANPNVNKITTIDPKTGIETIIFDLENGYVLKAEGEMLVGKQFVVYKDTMKSWEAPHENESLTNSQINDIIEEVKQNTNDNTVQIIFD